MKHTAFEQFAALERTHWWFRARRRVYLEILREALGSSRPRRVLDVGAGVGGFLHELGDLGQKLVHTEIDPTALQTCRERGYPHGVRASASSLPFRDETFDLICLFDVIEHVQDDQAVMAEVMRTLRPEGHVLLSVPAHPWLFSRNDVISGHRRRYTREGLRALCERRGLVLLRCTYTNSLLFPAIAGFLMAAKGLARLGLGRRDAQRTNLSWQLPGPINELLYHAFCAELLVSRSRDLPFGHSLLVIAQRRLARAELVTLRPRRPPMTRRAATAISTTAVATD